MKRITILVPCYNEQDSLPALSEALKSLMNQQHQYEWEVLLVNDGSRDNTISIIKEIRKEDKRFCYVDLSRNFGKENAMLAGFDYATGDAVVIMDADLQHPPSVIPEMLKKWEGGYVFPTCLATLKGIKPFFKCHLTELSAVVAVEDVSISNPISFAIPTITFCIEVATPPCLTSGETARYSWQPYCLRPVPFNNK